MLSFPSRWNRGSRRCEENVEPAFQVHELSHRTYALRQNKCHTFEGPFLYLLIGEEAALLIDSGAQPENGAGFPLREVIEDLLERDGMGDARLIVAHSHSHTDHLHGDAILAQRPNTHIVGSTRPEIQAAFSISTWPKDLGAVELGGRLISVLPTPGHEAHHLMFHDPLESALFSGDMLYPGRLTVACWPCYRASAARVAAFAESHEVRYVLGAHIEMKTLPGELFPIPSHFQPDEHALALGPEHVRELHEVCEALGDHPRFVRRNDFVIAPLGL